MQHPSLAFVLLYSLYTGVEAIVPVNYLRTIFDLRQGSKK